MKIRNIISALTLTFVLMAASCGKENTPEERSFEVTPITLDVESLGGQVSVNVVSSGGWLVRSDASWAKVLTASGKGSQTSEKVMISVEENTSKEARSAKISVSSLSGDNATVALTQAGSDGDTGRRGISSAEDLLAFATAVNEGASVNRYMSNGIVKIISDIDASSIREWTPAGTAEHPLTYSIDGGGHRITGISWFIDLAKTPYVGLVGYAKNASIRDIVLEGDGITLKGSASKVNAGAFVGRSDGCTMSMLVNKAGVTMVENTSEGAGIAIGGICGFMDSGSTMGGELKRDGCENKGDILASASCNVGGVAGHNEGLVTNCTNSGAVRGRNDYAGGIVGQAYIGQITDCQSYGAVSTDGSYVGGIAGRSDSSIRLSWAKCALSGEDYVGGIAGYGKTLSDCRSLVTVDGGAYTGAIAGDVDNDGSVTGCLFTHETLGAIDGISYAGKAEPATFEVLCAGSNVPKIFSQMELTFRADGKAVAVVPFQYGRGIDSLPEIPAKKGFSAVWPDLDYTHLTASQTLDAIYTPYSSSLTDDAQTLPQILVDGSFSSRATVSHTSEPVSWTDVKGTARTGTAVTVTVDDPDMAAISYTVHYRLPEDGKRYDLWVKTENGWETQDSTVDGSYLLFTSDQETVTFCVQERTASPLLWVLLAVLILLALMLVVIRIRKKRGRQTIRSRLRKARQKKS